jgi:hypothetical protein
MITLVIISCGRFNLLKRTIDSFNKFNTLPVKEVIIIEDSGDLSISKQIQSEWPEYHLITNLKNIGEIASIDTAYSEVKTPYIFHCEDDWEFYKPGFMEQSLTILENNSKILQVWLREHYDTNTHPIEPEIYTVKDVKYQLLATHAVGGYWHGFTWNPGLRRLADYKLVAPFSQTINEGDYNALTECHVGIKYFEMGFRAAILMEGYAKHIGYGQHVGH